MKKCEEIGLTDTEWEYQALPFYNAMSPLFYKRYLDFTLHIAVHNLLIDIFTSIDTANIYLFRMSMQTKPRHYHDYGCLKRFIAININIKIKTERLDWWRQYGPHRRIIANSEESP